MTKVLVIGAAGVLGRQMCERVVERSGAEALVVSDYRVDRAERLGRELGAGSVRVIDLTDVGSVAAGVQGADFVVVAADQKRPLVQVECIRQGVPSLDVGVNAAFLNESRRLADAADVPLQLVAAGLFPGFSGVMASHVYTGSDPVDVGLLQSARGSHGATGAIDMMRILSRRVQFLTDDDAQEVAGLSRSKAMAFPPPIGTQTLRLAAFVEQGLLKSCGVRSNFWTGFDTRGFNRAVVAAGRVGLLRAFRSERFARVAGPKLVAKPDGQRDERIGLCAQSPSRSVSYVLTSDYAATAACAVAMAELVLNGEVAATGVRFPFEVFALAQLEKRIADVIESVGGPDASADA